LSFSPFSIAGGLSDQGPFFILIPFFDCVFFFSFSMGFFSVAVSLFPAGLPACFTWGCGGRSSRRNYFLCGFSQDFRAVRWFAIGLAGRGPPEFFFPLFAFPEIAFSHDHFWVFYFVFFATCGLGALLVPAKAFPPSFFDFFSPSCALSHLSVGLFSGFLWTPLPPQSAAFIETIKILANPPPCLLLKAAPPPPFSPLFPSLIFLIVLSAFDFLCPLFDFFQYFPPIFSLLLRDGGPLGGGGPEIKFFSPR